VHSFAVKILIKDLDRDFLIPKLDDLADFDIVDGAKQGTLALRFPFAEVELVHGSRQAVCAVGEFEGFLGDPGVLKTSVDSDSFGHVDREHAVDEVEGRVADRVPVRGGVIEAASFDLLREVVGVFAGAEFIREGGEAAETDVEYDAEGPDVDGTGVFAMARVFEDFGGNVFTRFLLENWVLLIFS